MNTAKIETMTTEEAKERGYATFTGSTVNPHTVIDLSEVKEGAHTISIKLQNGECVTACIMPFFTIDGGKSGTIDIKYHNEQKETVVKTMGSMPSEKVSSSLYTLEY